MHQSFVALLMPAPFDYDDISRRAESMADELWQTGTYAKSTWNHPVFGPMARVYILLTWRPEAAFGDRPTPEHVAECRTYAYVLGTSIYDNLSRTATLEDGFFDLLSEYDALPDADLMGMKETALADSSRQLAKIKKSRKR
jgi:hypothetical protein